MATKVQYGIRHLMVLTVVVAVVMSILGPIVRAWNTERQTVFTACAAVALLLMAGPTYLLCLQRLRIERTAGEVILRTKPSASLRERALLVAGIAVCVSLMIAQWVLSSFAGTADGGLGLSQAVVRTFANAGVYAVILPMLLTRFWWGLSFSSLEFCEGGLISGGVGFLPYSALRRYRWGRHSAESLVLVGQSATWTLKIPPEAKEDIGRLFEQHGVRCGDGDAV